MTRAISIQPGGTGAADCSREIANDSVSQMFSADLARLIRAINDALVSENEKQEARLRLAELLKTPAAAAILGESVPHLLGLMEDGRATGGNGQP